MYLVVHDINPAIAGALAHLFQVALKTPVFRAKSNSYLNVVALGKFDLDTPLAADVVSERTEVLAFEPEKHLTASIGVVSLTGCDMDLLCRSGLIEKMVPIVPLSNMGNGEFLRTVSEKERLFNNFGVNATDVQSLYEQSQHLAESRISESIYLADCVFNCCNLIMRSPSIGNASIF